VNRSRRAHALFACLALAVPGPLFALDTSSGGPWARALREHTVSTRGLAGTEVDYKALRSSAVWPEVIADLERTPLASLETRSQKLAFWINAYNIAAVDLVVKHGPVQSIRDIGNFFFPVWKRDAVRIGGNARSLDEIEHDILRKLDDPRIHGALVCASLSCPDLRRTPFEAGRIGAQLDEQMRTWLANPEKGARIDGEGERIALSRVFDWFAGDFEPAGGILRFVGPFLSPDDRAWLAQIRRTVGVRFLPYDWDLNRVATTPREN